MTKGWTGGNAQRARTALAKRTQWPTQCGICGRPVNPGDDWQLDHITPIAEAPEQAWNPDNHRITHAKCNATRGSRLGHKRKPSKGSIVSSDAPTATPTPPQRAPVSPERTTGGLEQPSGGAWVSEAGEASEPPTEAHRYLQRGSTMTTSPDPPEIEPAGHHLAGVQLTDHEWDLLARLAATRTAGDRR